MIGNYLFIHDQGIGQSVLYTAEELRAILDYTAWRNYDEVGERSCRNERSVAT